MAELQHSQVRLKLLDGVVPHIDMTDIRAQAAEQSEAHALSRAVAATALCMSANVELAQAVASLVDGGDDNGIDAIHYDSQARTLFLVQSKWNTFHSGSVDSAAVLKYLHGVQDLVYFVHVRTRKSAGESTLVPAAFRGAKFSGSYIDGVYPKKRSFQFENTSTLASNRRRSKLSFECPPRACLFGIDQD